MGNRAIKNFAGSEEVLVVDDNVDVLNLIAEFGQTIGIKTDCFNHFETASGALSKKSYHALLADLFLDDSVDPLGVELIRLAQEQGIPVIAMTFNLTGPVAKLAMNSGALFMLEKPFSGEDLKSVLQKIWNEPRGLTGIVELFLQRHELTVKEREIARYLLKGLSNDEIANASHITTKTVKAHLTRIFSKCQVKNRGEFFNAVIPY